MRIFLLAKELEMSSKDLIAFLRTQGHNPSSHMSNIEDTVAQILRDRMKPKVPKDRGVKGPGDRPGVRGRTPLPGAPGGPPAAAPKEAPGVRPPRGPQQGGTDSSRGQDRTREATVGSRAGKGPGPGAKAEAGGTEWSESQEDEEKRRKEKEAEKGKEVPARKRYFPKPEDIYESGPRFGAGIHRKHLGRPRKSKDGTDGGVATVERPAKVEVLVPISARDLSAATGIRVNEIVKALWKQFPKVSINQNLDEDMVTAVALEFSIDISFKQKVANLDQTLRSLEERPSNPEDLVSRAPVVTFLGHVDHGKTSLLDKIRETNVASRESGGITQHIGAYRVDRGNIHVVFIDTPGHHSFSEMRKRGANVTDVAVLVVAADDGVMPQTEEALAHIRAAKVPIVVAINKIDKPTANILRAKQQLASLNLQPVEWGGDTEFCDVSALTSQGIDGLLETLSLTSEILELKANPKRPALGVVLEVESSASKGVLATVLVREGTLRIGDTVLCGIAYGRIRGMWSNGTEAVSEAGPSTPVTVTGLNSVSDAGDKLYVVEDLQMARAIAEEKLLQRQENERRPGQSGTAIDLQHLQEMLKKGSIPEVRFILKADVKGTLEALQSSLSQLSTPEVNVNIILAGVGAVNQGDVTLADASGAIVLAFKVSADEGARELAERQGIEVRTYDVIYQVVDDVRAALQGQLSPQKHEEVHGHVEIRQLFKASKVGTIAGCMVLDGFVARSDTVRVKRGGKVVHTGALSSLKRFKDDAKEVKAGFECGVKLADYEDVVVGDTLEAIAIVEKPRQL